MSNFNLTTGLEKVMLKITRYWKRVRSVTSLPRRTVSESAAWTAAEEEPYQDEVGLVSGEHEDGDVLLCQRSDDGLGDFRHPHGLRAAGSIAVGDHVERQPHGALHLEMFRGLEL